ncbi:MAG TPA: RidA family protein [Herpetosiphonaceae bacterium]
MQRNIVNPWPWQDAFGFVQANVVEGGKRTVYCAGQASVSDDGQPLHMGDLAAQIHQAFDNLETVLRAADMNLSQVVRLTYYTTDLDGLLANWNVILERLNQGQCKPASSVLGVTRLAFDLMIEIEATAVE